jgi:hypothetical protein
MAMTDVGDRADALTDGELEELLSWLPWFERRQGEWPRPYGIAYRALKALSALSKGAEAAGGESWFRIDDAENPPPMDGTPVRLLIDYDQREDADCWFPLDDEDVAWTFGWNAAKDDPDTLDFWHFVG